MTWLMIKTHWQRYKKSLLWAGAILVGLLEAISAITLYLLDISIIPLPWHLITIARFGMVTEIIIATVAVFTIASLLWAYQRGGVPRYLSGYVLLFIMSYITLLTATLAVFNLMPEHHPLPYPWQLMTHSYDGERFAMYAPAKWWLLTAHLALFFLILHRALNKIHPQSRILGSAKFANAITIARANLFTKEGMKLGKAYGKWVQLPGYESVLLVAPTGSGKTTTLAMNNLFNWDGSGIFNDLKGELYQLTAQHREQVLGQACFNFAPADKKRNTHRYNPLAYVRNDPHLIIRDLEIIAGFLFPQQPGETDFWTHSSRKIFTVVALYVIEEGNNPTLSHIFDITHQTDFYDWLDNKIRANAFKLTFAKQLAESIASIEDPRSKDNIMLDFQADFKLWADPLVRNATSGSDFDITRLRKTPMSIYIRIPTSDKERLKNLLTLFWGQCFFRLTEEEPSRTQEPHAVMALLDEFGHMAALPLLKEGLSFLRSYRIRALVMVQSIAQLIELYGQQGAEQILSAKARLLYTPNNYQDAEYFSKSMGQTTVRVQSQSHNLAILSEQSGHDNYSYNANAKPLMLPDEMMRLPKSQGILLVEGCQPIKVKKQYWFKGKRRQKPL